MRRDYSINERSVPGKENRLDKYAPSSTYQASWTDLRVEEIKKKYDTPSARFINSKSQLMSKPYENRPVHLRIKTEHRDPRSPLQETKSNQRLEDRYKDAEKIPVSRWDDRQIPVEPRIQPPSHHLDVRRDNPYKDHNMSVELPRKSITSANFYLHGGKNHLSKDNLSKQLTGQDFYPCAKVQEIKKSLDKDRSDKSFGRASIDRSRRELGFRTDSNNINQNKQFADPRIQNIDKINMKIKMILESLDYDQKQLKFNDQESLRSHHSKTSNSFLQRSALSREYNVQHKQTDKNEFEETKILEKQRIMYRADDYPSQKNHQMYLRRSPEKKTANRLEREWPNQITKSYLQESHKKDTIKEQQRMSNLYSESRSKSCLSGVRRSRRESISKQDSSEILTNGHVEEEISKFDQRIALLQQEKRKLNIQFKPYTYFDRSKQRAASPAFMAEYDTFIPKITQFKPSKQEYEERSKISVSRQPQSGLTDACEQNELYPKKFTFSNILNEEHQSTTNQPKDLHTCQETPQEPEIVYDNEELRKKIGERIQDRRKRMQMMDEGQSKRENTLTVLLVRVLCEQAKLDEEFRNAKNWFSEIQNPQKFTALQQCLRKRHLDMHIDQISKTFEISEDENDPFFSFREQKYTADQLVDSFINCEQHWTTSIEKRWDVIHLIQNQKLLERVDLQKKGFVAMEDIVRLLQSSTDHFYRNRDIYMIFKRMTKHNDPHHKLSFQQLQDTLRNPRL